MEIPKEIIECAKGLMLEFGRHVPTVFVFGTKKKTFFSLQSGDTLDERIVTMRKAGEIVGRHGNVGNLVRVIYVYEAWACPPRAEYIRPSQDPNRCEVLMISALDVAQNKQSVVMYVSIRDPGGKVSQLAPIMGGKPLEASSDLLPSFVLGFDAVTRVSEV
jgi:hypothetical protein